MYYSAIIIYNNPEPGNPIGIIRSIHQTKQQAYASACESLKAHDIAKPLDKLDRIVLIASVAQRFTSGSLVYRQDLQHGDIVKLSAIKYHDVKSI